ncbi:MAG: aldehyde dehydrogenase family protein [Pseudomonadota bacterium]
MNNVNEATAVPASIRVQAFLDRTHGHFIGNETIAPARAELDVFNPATGAVIARIPDGDAAAVDAAVASSRAALHGWSRTRPAERERILLRVADLLELHADELAEIETLNQGKSINIARAVEVAGSVDTLRYMAGWATKIEGSTLDVSTQAMPGAQFRAMTLRQPVGVVAAIVPWNFPLAIAIWKIAPALACSCTVVLKPSEETPLSVLRLAELFREAGLPAGVLNVVLGRGASAGAALASHPGVDKLTFTGSTQVGKLIGNAALQNMTRFSLELGGKSPMIVLDDADVDQAVQGAAMGIFFNNGQVCTASSRLYVQRGIYDQVVDKLAALAGGMKIGPGIDPTSQINPLVSARHRDRVLGFIEQARRDGATVATGGAHEGAGYYVKPTVLTGVNAGMAVVREEIFGPVIVAMPFDTIEEVIGLANDSVYGLAASVWSNDYRSVMRLTQELQAGTVWVNTHNIIDPNVPFGGFKQSGLGREMGRAVIDLYTESKSVMMAY